MKESPILCGFEGSIQNDYTERGEGGGQIVLPVCSLYGRRETDTATGGGETPQGDRGSRAGIRRHRRSRGKGRRYPPNATEAPKRGGRVAGVVLPRFDIFALYGRNTATA